MKKIIYFLLIASFLIPHNIVFALDSAEPAICNYEYPANTKLKYDFEFLGSKKSTAFTPGEVYEVTLYIKNTGTMPMFSDDAGCRMRDITRLGSAKPGDHENPLFPILINHDTGWLSPNRIILDQQRLDPGEKGSFTFLVKAPMTTGVYREFFDVVIDGKQWISKPFVVNFDVGTFMSENRDKLQYVTTSRLITQDNLNGSKSIEVDISEQRMYLKVGDIVIRSFPVSTGKSSTPTPYGHTQILAKQEVRVGGAWPHYIMPKWLNFRRGGYGIHALPSIRYDNGYYWREALNHIGTPRSHGCIRLLPADAVFAYDFAEIGTSVWVHQ
ncbi:L,D-transpeptidase family protein [Candidatus Peregrinibacteria bacterium]|nr:L,D-transpeptidase family protein [Candidatus Peregrinibacteria bacterium]